MSLILGIRCKDGVIIGSDSAMTFGATPQQCTIEQPCRSKIDIIDDHVIVAGTGAVGLGQRFVHETDCLWKTGSLKEKAIADMGRLISQAALKNFSSTGIIKLCGYGALVAIPRNGTAELIEFDSTSCQPEAKSDTGWYVSMGAGQMVADPLLGFVRKVFWGDSPPKRQDGIFAATMVLTLALEMAPFGVGGPIQMAVLEPQKKGKSELSARRLTEAELLEHRQNAEGAFNYMREYQDHLQGDPQGPKLPSPPIHVSPKSNG